MKQCKRNAANIAALWFVVILFFVVGAGALVVTILSPERLPGTVFREEDLLSKPALILCGIGFTASSWSFTGYALFILFKKRCEGILYDDDFILFHFSRDDERRFTWQQMRQNAVTMTWLAQDRMLLFSFEDGRRMKIPQMYSGFHALYQTLLNKSIPADMPKDWFQRIEQKGAKAQKRFRRAFLLATVLLALTGLCFLGLSAQMKRTPSGEPVPFDPSNPNEAYAYLDVYYAEIAARAQPNGIYYLYTYNSQGKRCVFTYGGVWPNMSRDADRVRQGDLSVLEGKPILRITGYTSRYTSRISRMFQSMYMQDYDLSQQEFNETFGYRYLTNVQTPARAEWYNMIGFYTLLTALVFGLALRVRLKKQANQASGNGASAAGRGQIAGRKTGKQTAKVWSFSKGRVRKYDLTNPEEREQYKKDTFGANDVDEEDVFYNIFGPGFGGRGKKDE